jgi:hypothetical protein
MLCSGYLPDLTMRGLPGYLLSPDGAPVNLYIDSTCTWCHSDVTSPTVPSSDHDLPWLRIVHRLILCSACSPGRRPVSYFFSDMFLLTSDWPCYHNCLDDLCLPMYGSTPPVRHAPWRPPLITTLTFSAFLLIPPGLNSKTRLQISKSPHRIAFDWALLQPQPKSMLCVPASLLCASSPIPCAPLCHS